MGKMIQTWVGECSAWECDDLGHMNMRHYMTKVHQARQMFIIRLGLDDAFRRDSVSSVRARDIHIKYLGEARPGAPLRIETGLLSISGSEAQLCHIMYHADDRLAATIVETVEHISLVSMKAFDWAQRVGHAAGRFIIDQPGPSQPRHVNYAEKAKKPKEKRLKKLGAPLIGMGVFQPHEMGVDKRATVQSLLGRVTETIAHYLEAWPELHDEDYRAAGHSAALLEARIVIHNRPEVGDAYHFYSGVSGCNEYTRSLVHNVVDAVTGKSFFSMVGHGCQFNLNTRKLIKTSAEQQAQLRKVIIPDLTI